MFVIHFILDYNCIFIFIIMHINNYRDNYNNMVKKIDYRLIKYSYFSREFNVVSIIYKNLGIYGNIF